MPRNEGSAAARNLRGTGYLLMTVFAAVAVAVLVGETLTDPGAPGVVGVLGWALGPATLAWLALRRPAMAGRLLAGLTLAATALWLWFVVVPLPWIELMDERGPLLPLLVLVVVLPTAVLARHDPVRAGLGLVVLGLAPALAYGMLILVEGAFPVDVVDRARSVLLGAAVASGAPPALLAGVLFLLSAPLDRRSRAVGARVGQA